MGWLAKATVNKGQVRVKITKGQLRREQQIADANEKRRLAAAAAQETTFWCDRCGIYVNRSRKPKRCQNGHRIRLGKENMTIQDKPGRGDSRALMWVGHYAIYGVLLYAPVTIAATVTGTHIQWLNIATVAALAVLMASVLIQWRYHDQRLCERCIADSPLDPQAAVEKWEPALREHHRALTSMAAVLLVVAGYVSTVTHAPKWLPVFFNVLLILVIVVWFVDWHVHRRLYPWCPWCHWDEGGDEEKTPDLPQVPQETR